ncbi:hypothetical protein [Gordonia araii]|nr:hypothetical protein [Gordonia araii]NNG98922.1 hypothetical protein [Gordonia araii NBRC 100433]
MEHSDDTRIVLRADALAAGITDRELAALDRLAPGCYVPRSDRRFFPEERHRLVAIAMAAKSGGVLSHQSAAAVHGLGMLSPDFKRVHFTSVGAHGNIRGMRHTHSGFLADDEVVVVNGVEVTSIERTAVDVACAARFPGALTIMDSALRAGADRDRMEELCAASQRRGIRVARRALVLGDGQSANPGESWSRAQMIAAGLPLPTLQREMWIGGRQYFLDFDFGGRIDGEFDGERKYTEHRRPGEDAAAVVIREKNRENAIRSTGMLVERWDWSDLRSGAMIPRVTKALKACGLV